MVPLPTGEEVALFLGEAHRDEDGDLHPSNVDTAQFDYYVEHVADLVRQYTRGVGFGEQTCAPALARVIVSAAARICSNPANRIRVQIGGYSEMLATFDGFLLPEQMVLNEYRMRTA